jgi:hypothetical protein
MATEPTGRPRGRPKNAKPAKPKGKKGRPKKPLNADPERYSFALLQHHIDRGRAFGLSERSICDLFASITHGIFIETVENSVALLSGKPFAVRFKKNHFVQGGEGDSWRAKNAFRPLADNMYRKFRKLRQDTESAKWLDDMSRLWETCFARNPEYLIQAQDLAESLDERPYFEEKMRPILLEQDARFLRVQHFLETGDFGYWAHNRLNYWPKRSVRISYGDNLLKTE